MSLATALNLFKPDLSIFLIHFLTSLAISFAEILANSLYITYYKEGI